jgi:hypothetical protein
MKASVRDDGRLIQIQSIGPPPEKHADRVVAEMLRIMAAEHARVSLAIWATIESSSDGSPKAQRKMEARIRAAGARLTRLTPGKRGRYDLEICDLSGWDAARDTAIELGDAIPDEPWIACWFTFLTSEGKGRGELKYKSAPILFITHHAFSRAAQRWEARTIDHMQNVIEKIWIGIFKHLASLDRSHWSNLPPSPPQGLRIQVGEEQKLTVVIKRHEKHNAFIAVTVF